MSAIHRRPQKHRPIGIRVLRLFGICVLACGLVLWGWQLAVRRSYQQLAKVSAPLLIREANDDTVTQTEVLPAQRDWSYLRDCNNGIAAWVTVEGTDIDLPVVSAAGHAPDFYLTHDFWGRWALEGTPFLDVRCQADGRHRLVYGHHLSSGGQFSELQKAYEEERFQGLGSCLWETPATGKTMLLPLCSMRVDASYQPIQTFDFVTDEDFHAWLLTLAEDASARAPGWRQHASTAQSAVTLVTCASDQAGQRARTLVTFVEVSVDLGHTP